MGLASRSEPDYFFPLYRSQVSSMGPTHVCPVHIIEWQNESWFAHYAMQFNVDKETSMHYKQSVTSMQNNMIYHIVFKFGMIQAERTSKVYGPFLRNS